MKHWTHCNWTCASLWRILVDTVLNLEKKNSLKKKAKQRNKQKKKKKKLGADELKKKMWNLGRKGQL